MTQVSPQKSKKLASYKCSTCIWLRKVLINSMNRVKPKATKVLQMKGKALIESTRKKATL